MTRSLKSILGPMMILTAGIVLYFTAGVALMDWRTNQFTRLAALKTDVAAMTDRIATLEADLTNVSDQDITNLFWTASQPGEATALVQSSLSGTASDNGILMRSITPYTPRDSSIDGAFGFRLEFETHLDQLTEFLKQVEYDRPALVIDRTVLRRLNRPGDEEPQPALFVQIEILAPVILTGEVDTE